jgi:oxaloacetate decarboxylase beta subunit
LEFFDQLWAGSGLAQITGGQFTMIVVSLVLLYLAIAKKFEPLLLVTIGFGGLLSNIPGVEIATGDGLLHLIYVIGIETGAFPLLIFMGVGAMTDFGPVLANPKTFLLGAAAQFGIFATLLGALVLSSLGWMEFSLSQAAAIGIIGGADGPTAIFVAGKLAPELLGAIAIAAYSYMALGAHHSAADHEGVDQRRRAQNRDGPIARGQSDRAHCVSIAAAVVGGISLTLRSTAAGNVLLR